MKRVIVYTDGACSGNPGAGGWAAILKYGKHEKEISGFEESTTNNRMEMTAAIKALEALKEPCEANVYSDSAYLVNAFKKGWVKNWKQNGWITSKKEKVRNQDLWEILCVLTKKHRVTWLKVKGHADDELNNRCDKLAVAQIKDSRDLT